MKFIVSWILGLFAKPEEEITVFPAPVKKKKPQVKKATTRTAKKPAVIAKTVAAKKTVKKAKTK